MSNDHFLLSRELRINNLFNLVDLKMMVKSGLESFILKFTEPRVAVAQCKNIRPERLNWPGRLVGISEGAL